MFQINILNLLEWRLYHENVVGYESSGYETSMGTKRLDTNEHNSDKTKKHFTGFYTEVNPKYLLKSLFTNDCVWTCTPGL